MFFRNLFYLFLVLSSFFYSKDALSIVKIENVKQGAIDGKGLVRIYMSSKYDLSKVEKNFAKDHVELIFKDTFIIPATNRVFKPSSSRSSVIRMQASLLSGTRVSVKIFFRISIDIVKATFELEQVGDDIVFYYRVKIPESMKEETKAKLSEFVEDKKENDIEKDSKIINTVINDKDSISNKSEEEDLLLNNKVSDLSKDNKDSIASLSIDEKTKKKGPSLFWSFIKMIMVLGFIIAIFLIGIYFFKKYYKGPLGLYGKSLLDPNIKVEGKLSIEFGKNLYIINVGGQRHLIACSKDRVTYLSSVDLNTINKDKGFEDNLKKESLLLAGIGANKKEKTLSTSLKERLKEKKQT